MTPGVRPLVAGNWKMNGLVGSLHEIKAMRDAVDAGVAGEAEVIVCPPTTLLARAGEILRGGKLRLGAQDCHPMASGAHTGDISAQMLRDAGASHVIVGHSERRAAHGETDDVVFAKAEGALRAGLVAIVCVGETNAERRAGRAVEVVSGQLRGSLPRTRISELVVAYEPVWAIGTGVVPTAAWIAQTHAAIRALLIELYHDEGARIRILYGGSVKASNAKELMCLPNVDGALVGGASLKAADFMAIVATYA